MAEGQEDVDEEYRQSVLMEAGRYTLQQAALIIGQLWFVGDMGVRRRILLLLHQQVRDSNPVQGTLRFCSTQACTLPVLCQCSQISQCRAVPVAIMENLQNRNCLTTSMHLQGTVQTIFACSILTEAVHCCGR